MQVTLHQAQSFLNSHFDSDISNVEIAGAGAWSTCYGFHKNQQELVIRFGKYLDDFQTDKQAFAYNNVALPVPEVLELGKAFDGYYAISTRVYGAALERLSSNDWLVTVPSLVSTLEALRLADVSTSSGFGGWKSDGNGAYSSWAEFLLSVVKDTPDQRTHGWREKLATFGEGEEAFVWGLELLKQVAQVSILRCLVHSDLMNRNVFVDENKISGVFDWGCALYGDHLYDLAWFEFWAPWHPELDVGHLRKELERQWEKVGYKPQDMDSRLQACYLHIGLGHLGYNAHLEDWETLLATAKRMQTLVKL
jgi:hygromycin-B 4-O-kinase